MERSKSYSILVSEFGDAVKQHLKFRVFSSVAHTVILSVMAFAIYTPFQNNLFHLSILAGQYDLITNVSVP